MPASMMSDSGAPGSSASSALTSSTSSIRAWIDGLPPTRDLPPGHPPRRPETTWRAAERCPVYVSVRDLKAAPHTLSRLLPLVQRLVDCHQGCGIVQTSLRGHLTAAGDPSFCDRDFAEDDASFERYGHGLPIEVAENLVDSTREYENFVIDDAGWISGVQHPILDAVLRSSKYPSHFRTRNITRTHIRPDLVPEKSEHHASHIRTFDLAYVFATDEVLNIGYANHSRLLSAKTNLNHVDAGFRMYEPIAISVSTKTVHAGLEERTQLAIWAGAHFDKLDELIDSTRIMKFAADSSEDELSEATTKYSAAAHEPVHLPPLPLLTAQREKWQVYFATREPGQYVHIWECGSALFCSRTFNGIYSLTAALHALLCWVQEEYRSWFYRHAVPLTPAQREHFRIDEEGEICIPPSGDICFL